ncbi:MAG: amidohydrolase family protein [Phycisphaerales bacterium]|nr:amidohydrolase family protein [Phycisphaerales bacterium]
MILRAAWVAPGDAAPIRDGYVQVLHDRVQAVGALDQAPAPKRREVVVDLGTAVITPGLINPHSHLELGCYAGQLPRGPLWPWLAELIRVRRIGDQVKRETAAAGEFAWRSLQAGVTCVGDASRRNLGWRALADTPIRKVCFVELLSIADQPPRTIAELRAAMHDVAENGLLTAGVSPHAPYTVPAADARAAIQLASALNRPWMIHLAETPEEVAYLSGDISGMPPGLAQAQRNAALPTPSGGVGRYVRGLLSSRPAAGYLAHGNYLADDDIAAIAEAGCAVVYCPRAHAYYGHADHPLERLRAAGVTVAIGTDSPACDNADLSPWRELAQLREAHAALADDDDTLLRFVTVYAAEALGMADRVGALRPGMLADIAAFPLDAPTERPIRALIDAAPDAARVWVGGDEVKLT